MTHFPLRNGHKSITLVSEITSVWKGRWRVILSKQEYLFVGRFNFSSLEEFSFCHKGKYSYNESDALN